MLEDAVVVILTEENIAETAEKAGITEDFLLRCYNDCLDNNRRPALKYYPKEVRDARY